MQYTDDSILRSDIRIMQPEQGYRFALDAVLLATFVKTKSSDAVLELGAGSGVVSIVIGRTRPYHSITAVEIQAELAQLCRKNFEANRLKNAIVLEQDVKNLDSFLPSASFDLICCNPPYRKLGTGRLNPSRQKAVARHEIKMKLEDVFQCATQLLRPDGRLTLILPVFRESDFLSLAERHQFYCREHKLIHSFAQEGPAFFLATLGKSPGQLIESPPMVIYEKPGEYTDEMTRVLLG